jgi:hypothetical protein
MAAKLYYHIVQETAFSEDRPSTNLDLYYSLGGQMSGTGVNGDVRRIRT